MSKQKKTKVQDRYQFVVHPNLKQAEVRPAAQLLARMFVHLTATGGDEAWSPECGGIGVRRVRA